MIKDSADSTELARLAAFQATLLQTLHTGENAAEIRARLTAAASEAGLAEYVASFDDRMLLVASELVRRWGSRTH